MFTCVFYCSILFLVQFLFSFNLAFLFRLFEDETVTHKGCNKHKMELKTMYSGWTASVS